MKRVIFGVIWLIVFIIVFNIIYGIVVSITAAHHAGLAGAVDRQRMMDAARAYQLQHAGSMAAWRLIILIVSIILAVAGAVTGFLPGTRKKKIAAPSQ